MQNLALDERQCLFSLGCISAKIDARRSAIRSEAGAGKAGFHQGNMDAKLPHFMVQGFGVALQGVLAGCVEVHVRLGDHS